MAAAPPSLPAPRQEPSPPPSPAIVATFRSYFLGCFAFAFDTTAYAAASRALPITLATNDEAMTVAKCAGLAQAAGGCACACEGVMAAVVMS